MTVRELIDKLTALPDDTLPVMVCGDDAVVIPAGSVSEVKRLADYDECISIELADTKITHDDPAVIIESALR